MLLTLAVSTSACETISDWIDRGDNEVRLEGERVPILASNEDITPDPDLAALTVELPPPIGNADWPQAGDTPTNKIDHLQAAGPLRAQWAADAGKGSDDDSLLTASPIVADGIVYTQDAEGHVFAFNAVNGARIWDSWPRRRMKTSRKRISAAASPLKAAASLPRQASARSGPSTARPAANCGLRLTGAPGTFLAPWLRTDASTSSPRKTSCWCSTPMTAR